MRLYALFFIIVISFDCVVSNAHKLVHRSAKWAIVIISKLFEKALLNMLILFELIKYCLFFKNNFELEKNNVILKKRHSCIYNLKFYPILK